MYFVTGRKVSNSGGHPLEVFSRFPVNAPNSKLSATHGAQLPNVEEEKRTKAKALQ